MSFVSWSMAFYSVFKELNALKGSKRNPRFKKGKEENQSRLKEFLISRGNELAKVFVKTNQGFMISSRSLNDIFSKGVWYEALTDITQLSCFNIFTCTHRTIKLFYVRYRTQSMVHIIKCHNYVLMCFLQIHEKSEFIILANNVHSIEINILLRIIMHYDFFSILDL